MFQYIFGVAGGLAIFLYGMSLSSTGLQKVSGSALKSIIHKLTTNPVFGMLVGVLATFLIQSSTATTIILVSLVGANLMTLAQSIGVILGADVGTTLTVQLIAFKITSYALLFIALGFALSFIAKRPRMKYLGQIIMGFGFVFYGIHIMTATVEPLREYEAVREMLIAFGRNPFLGLVVAALFTVITNSSAATIGLVFSLALQGLVPLEAAIPLILGANVGTCSTALLATIGAPTDAKRVGVAHVLFKLLGVILIIPFIGPFAELVRLTSTDAARQIANAHTLFNVGIAVVFLPFARPFAQLIELIVPERAAGIPDVEEPLYLERHSLSTPVLALEQVRAEIVRIARIINQMTVNLSEILVAYDEDLATRIWQLETGVDALYRHVVGFLADIAQSNLTEEQSHENVVWIQVTNDLEHIGDSIIRMLQSVTKKLEHQVVFSNEGQHELEELFSRVVHLSKGLITAFESPSEENLAALRDDANDIIAMEQQMRVSHIRRLHAQIAVSRDTSPIHLDLTNAMRRIADHTLLIVKNMSGVSEKPPVEESLNAMQETVNATAGLSG
ncbi:MAG: Na/Pi cotransporter family protein [Firmicutes bacterium]|nr:Na/Pi cotransporter family protein [Bacillota bacterium]